MSDTLDAEVEALADLFPWWARQRRDICVVPLIGSWAYRLPRPDSDLDVLLLIERPSLYTEREDWAAQLGGVALLTTRSWGAITERRFRLPGGLEVEVGVGPPRGPPSPRSTKVLAGSRPTDCCGCTTQMVCCGSS